MKRRDSSLPKISEIVEQDIGISAKILQLANSAFFGCAHHVSNIQNAVGYRGLNALKCPVLSLEVFTVFKPKMKVPGFSAVTTLTENKSLSCGVFANSDCHNPQ